jgi:diphthamide synthase (EF-2-diphthine--ammonia ligase)
MGGRLLLFLEVLEVVAVGKALQIQQLEPLAHLDKAMLVEKVLEAMLLTQFKVAVVVVAQELLDWMVFLA